MKRIISIGIFVLSIGVSLAQTGFDTKIKTLKTPPKLDGTFTEISGKANQKNINGPFKSQSIATLHESINLNIYKDDESGSVIFIENKQKAVPSKFRKSANTQGIEFLNEIKSQLQVVNANEEFEAISSETDEQGLRHTKFQQKYKGVKLYGAEVYVHSNTEKVNALNGRVFATPVDLKMKPKISSSSAIELGLIELGKTSILKKQELASPFINLGKDEVELIIYFEKSKPVLAYEMVLRPNALERWVVFMNANSGEIIDKYNHTCTLDGVFSTQAKDLNGVTRAFNIYQSGSKYVLVDPSKSMFNSSQSKLPDSPVGAIWTIDALNSSIDGDMQFDHVKSNDGTTWNPAAVSAHNNASICYDYYLKNFKRNSLNNKGGNIVSVINITDEDGKGMDNAYWNGEFMGYGNGGQAFKPLAGALDVAGHEMTHGVIENTARLEYRNQSGALNESFADIFGALIDRDDWTLGEDVVKSSVFPSGALRSLQNPNQGGPRDPGYQPKNMSQYVYLKDTPSEDNGGVHVNSGIPNHAFYLFATGNGMNKDKAEKVYYQALTNYMTRTSKFLDLRLAVIQSAKDIYGNGQEAIAAASAFDQVGIAAPGTGQTVPDNTEEIIPVNQGTQFLVVYEPEGKDIYRVQLGTTNYDLISEGKGCQRKPSLTDDGTAMYFVGDDHNIYKVDLTKKPTSPQSLSDNGAWANVAISKNGKLLAALTSAEDAKIYVFNLVTNKQASFNLYNPTYTQGVSTGEVLYADAIEWDYSGEYIIYDAFNEVKSFFGNVEYWDVGVLRAWSLNVNDFGDGDIQKIFTDLDEGDNIGNPAISKTNPNIIAFDYLDAINDQFYILGLNLNSGDIKLTIENNTVGYPDYTVDDKELAYTSEIQGVGEAVKLIQMNDDRISTNSKSGTRLFDSGQDKWAVFYAQGTRKLPTKEAQTIQFAAISSKEKGAVFTLNATASSGLPIQYAVVSGDATLSGNKVTLGSNAGLVTIQAIQVGNDNFTSKSAEQTFCINPSAPTITSNGEVIAASASAMYQWYINGNPLGGQTNKNQIAADRTGKFSVKAATLDGCLSGFSNSIDIVLQVQVLSSAPNENTGLSLYPNPSQEKVKLKMLNGQKFLSAEVIDTAGLTVLKTASDEFSVLDLKAGLYLVKIKTSNGSFTEKFVKN
jgi:bacillolysin